MSDLDARFRARARAHQKFKGPVAVLDLGATKITCLIARINPATPEAFEVLGAGHQTSRGMKNGAVVDMEGLERSVRLAVEDAEREAGEVISEVFLTVGGIGLSCEPRSAEIDTAGQEVTDRHINKLIEQALEASSSDGRMLLHALPRTFMIDGNDGVTDPCGMYADRLGLAMNVITAPTPAFRNLALCVSRAHLKVAGTVASPLVSALSVLVEDEFENGVVCIDLGGGASGVSVFESGRLTALGMVGVGGMHITSDIAQGLGTTFAAAERIKTLNGTVLRSQGDANQMVKAPQIGDDGRLQAGEVSKARLVSVIEPRATETFELIQQRLEALCGKGYPRRAVLTGGGSQLPGLRELAAKTLRMPVRLGKPKAAEKLGDGYAGPAFSTASGLLEWLTVGMPDAVRAGTTSGPSGGQHKGVVGRALGWLRENI